MIDEKERWTAKRLKLALAVAETALLWYREQYGNDYYPRKKAREALNAYVAFIDAGKPKAKKTKGKGRKRK